MPFHNYFEIFFHSILLFQVLAMLTKWVIHRTKGYLFYTAYLLFIGFFYALKSYNAHTESLEFYSHWKWCFSVGFALFLGFYYRFYRYVLPLRENYLNYGRLFFYTQYVLLGYVLLDVALSNWLMDAFSQTILWLLFFAIHFSAQVSGVYLFNKTFTIETPISHYLRLGTFVFIFGVMFGISMLNYVLWSGDSSFLRISDYILQTIVLCEIACSNLALAHIQRLRIEEIKQKNRALERFIEERQVFATFVHSDVKNSLMAIKNNAKLLPHTEGTDFNNILDGMLKWVRLKYDRVDKYEDILSERFNFDDLIEVIREEVMPLAEMQDVQIKTNLDNSINEYLTPFTKYNLYMSCKEAVSNALQHAKCSVIWIDLLKNEAYITLKIRDNGVGIDEISIKKSGGFLTYQNVATRIGATFSIESQTEGEKSGTSIIFTLKIPKIRY